MTPTFRMDRRAFCRAGTLAVGSALLPPFLAHAAVFPEGTTMADLTFRLQVATADDFASGTLVFDRAGLADPFETVGGLRASTRYHWRVSATDGTVTSPWSETFSFSTGIAVGTDAPAPGALVFELGRNYPNPVRDVTRIPFVLSEHGRVTVEVFNVIGQRILVLLDEERAAGRHEIAWDVSGLAAGTYVYSLQAGTQHATRRLSVVK